LGYSSQAVADYSIALGRSYVSGQEGFAAQIGNNTSSYGASGVNSIAMGYLADADYRSVAIGYNVGGSGSYGISLGSDSGVGIYASSAAIGRNVQSTASNQVSIGGSTQDVRISETYTLPRVDGSANQVLTTDGSGAVSWATAGGATDINGLSDAVSNTWKSLALGADAGASLVSGTHGYNSGEYNTLVGQLAGTSITTGESNVAVGYGAVKTATTADWNVGISVNSLRNLTTGTHNIGIGYQSARSTTTGSKNVAVGNYALYGNTTANEITAVGYQALRNSTGNYSTAVGYNALTANTSGTSNTAVGNEALTANTTGGDNVGIGYRALKSVTTGSNNTGLGLQAGFNTTTGTNNTFFGRNAGYSLNTSSDNTFIGNIAGVNITSGYKNTILGRYNGNQGGLDIRTSSNNIVLSDGDGNPRLSINSSGVISGDGSGLTGTGGSTTFGAVGTYTVAMTDSGSSASDNSGGATIAGSSLRKNNGTGGTNTDFQSGNYSKNATVSSGLSGTWRYMSRASKAVNEASYAVPAALFVRIS
jgi:hypothetical protein